MPTTTGSPIHHPAVLHPLSEGAHDSCIKTIPSDLEDIAEMHEGTDAELELEAWYKKLDPRDSVCARGMGFLGKEIAPDGKLYFAAMNSMYSNFGTPM